MKQVTYGVTDLIDWNARIPVGRACMNVHFTGGALTKYGVTPAEYTTTDPFTQRVIEDSEYFRSGRITILRSVGSPEARAASRRDGVERQKASAEAPVPADAGGHTARPGLKEVEAACLEDAMEYLRSNYGVQTYKVRSMAAAQELAARHGERFIFPDEAND